MGVGVMNVANHLDYTTNQLFKVGITHKHLIKVSEL